MVTMNVAATIQNFASFFLLDSIFNSIFLALNGNKSKSTPHEINSITMTKGTILTHQSPKATSMPSCSLR